MGSWLNMLGVAVEVGAMIGYIVIMGLNLSYYTITKTSMSSWPYYPVCGLLVLLAYIPIQVDTPNPSNPRMGWGAAAGLPVEVLNNTLGVVKCARTWKRKVDAKKLRSEEGSVESSEEGSPDPGVLGGIVRRMGLSRLGTRHFGFSRQSSVSTGSSSGGDESWDEGSSVADRDRTFGLSGLWRQGSAWGRRLGRETSVGSQFSGGSCSSGQLGSVDEEDEENSVCESCEDLQESAPNEAHDEGAVGPVKTSGRASSARSLVRSAAPIPKSLEFHGLGRG